MDLLLPDEFFERFAEQCAKWGDVNATLQDDITPGAIRKEMLNIFERSLSEAWHKRFPLK